MSCDICGRGSCANWMHSLEEQDEYAKVIEAFERARDLRSRVRDELAEALLNQEENQNDDSSRSS